MKKKQTRMVLTIGIAVMALLVFTASAAAQTSTTVSVESAAVESGETFTINVTLSDTPAAGVGAYGFNISFDTSVVQVTDANALVGFGIPNWDNDAGWVILGGAVYPGAGDGIYGDITFEAIGASGTSTILGMTVDVLKDEDVNPITYTVTDGLVTIGEVTVTSVTVESKTVAEGGTTTIDVTLSDTPAAGIGAYGFNITFDPSVVQVTDANALVGFGIPNWDNDAGWVILGGAVYPGAGDGIYGDITFEAIGASGTSTILGMTVDVLKDEDVNPITYTVTDGSITVGVEGRPTIVSYTITPPIITPPQTTEIDVEFSERVEAWIKIEDVDRNLVNELYHSTGVTDPDPKTWDGTYTDGTVVPAGDYYVNVTGLNTTTGLSVVNNTETVTVQAPPEEQVPISNVEGGYRPDIALSSAGDIYVAFEGYASEYGSIDFTKSTDGGAVFSTQIIAGGAAAGAEYAAIAAYGENNVYVVWYEGYNVYYARSTNGGDSFETAVQVNDAGGDSYENPDIAVDSTGVIYVVWETFSTIHIAKSIDGETFGADVNVSSGFSVAGKPSVAIDGDDNILVAWSGRIIYGNNHVYLAKSTDGGAAFSAAVMVSAEDTEATYPSVVVDPADSSKIYVAWTDGDIYAAASSDGGASFGAGVKVNDDTTDAEKKYPCMAVNSSGAIFVVWQDGRNYEYDSDIYFAGSLDGGSTFSANVKVNPNETKAKTPTLTVDDTNAFVAWKNTDDQIIYFRKGVLSEWMPVEEIVLTTITVTPATANVAVDGTQLFTATAYDQNSEVMADVVITWTSSDETVGTVNPLTATTGADGTATTTFTALAEGTTTVMAASGDVSGTAVANVISDTTPPVVTSPTAAPDTIPADGTTPTVLSVTVTDDSEIHSVTIDLSAIGGSATAVMSDMGDNVYSVTTTAAVGTTTGLYNLQVNATDIYGNSNTDVSIPLAVTPSLPTVTITTDKTDYSYYETMDITINIKNPTADSIDTYFVWYFGLPDYGYETRILVKPLTLTPNCDWTYNTQITIPYWGYVGFNASWQVELRETAAPYDVISVDTADWRYVGMYGTTAEGEITPADISKEIEKEINEKFKI